MSVSGAARLGRTGRGALGGAAAVAAIVLACMDGGCGSRTGLVVCVRDSDCRHDDLCKTVKCVDRQCVEVAHKTCDDSDPCTDDSCDKKTGNCIFTGQTLDLDGDGHHAPKAGFDPGAPGSCGDDCDDTDPRAFPGNKEVCDGIDNDCDGIVDNGARYTPSPGAETQLSAPGFDWAEPDSLVRGGTGNVRLLATYDASQGDQLLPYLLPLDALGKPTNASTVLTGTVAAGSGTAVAWTGDRYGIAWGDRRDGNFEIYFALLDPSGAKMAPGDERITVSSGFSIYPSLVWTGSEFDLVWQEEVGGGTFTIEGQRIALDGRLIGDIVKLTPGKSNEQGPALAAGRKELGLTWVRGDATTHGVLFQPLDFTLSPKAEPTILTSGGLQGAGPDIVFNRTSYVVSFFDPRAGKRTVYGTVVGGDGSIIVPPTDIAVSPGESRDSALIPLGDRVLFVYADDRDNNQGYELYTRTLWADLTSLGPPARVTAAPGDSIAPRAAFAPDGTVLVIFRDDRGLAPAVFETGLACDMPK